MTNFYWKEFNNKLKYEDNRLNRLANQFDSKYSKKYKELYKQVMTHNGVTNDR